MENKIILRDAIREQEIVWPGAFDEAIKKYRGNPIMISEHKAEDKVIVVPPIVKDGRIFEVLLQDSGMPKFLIEYEQGDLESHCDFKVFEVMSWNMENVPENIELYVRGTIKWDGCSHIWFGTEDKDGYIHLCGKHSFVDHCKLIAVLWEVVTAKIKCFDKETAE